MPIITLITRPFSFTTSFFALRLNMLALLCSCLYAPMPARAQTPVLQAPSEFLAHRLGENFTHHHRLVDYFNYVASKSTTVKTQVFGYTYDDRPQLAAIISAPQNMRLLEVIRQDNLRRAGLLNDGVNITTNIAIVWLGFSVHGNEPAGSEAAMQVLYELVTAADKAQWLNHTVVIIDPSQNPDGYARYTNWYRDSKGAMVNIDLNAREHQEPWPGGRVNHYLFDLNRDWAWLTQVESRNRVQFYHQWMPHVHPDLHEQGINEPYYFAPAAQPYHPYITAWQSEAQTGIGKNHARYFDSFGWLYFTREIFDLLYPSYGDTYPMYNGAIGMTYEQGGIDGGVGVRLHNGDTLTLKDRIAHHTITALSTIEYTAQNADRLVKEFANFYKNAATSPPGIYKSYLLQGNSQKLNALKDLLQAHHIQTSTVAAGQKINGFDFTTQQTTTVSAAQDNLVINLNQPMATLAQILLEPTTGLVDSMTYDITAWSLPYAYGLSAVGSKNLINTATEPQRPAPTPPPALTTAPYALAITPEGLTDYKTIFSLAARGFRLRYNTEPTTLEGQLFPKGTYFVLRGDNQDRWAGVPTLYPQWQGVKALRTGLAEKGIDLGSARMQLITNPSVAVVYGDQVSNNEYGQVWHYFDNDIVYPFTPITLSQLGSISLAKFSTIILPEGYYSLDAPTTIAVEDWVQKGGKLIAIGTGIQSLVGKGTFGITKKESTKADSMAMPSVAEAFGHYSERERKALVDFIPGAIFKTKVDDSHPLGYHLGAHYYSLKTNGLKFELLKNGTNVIFVDKNPFISGFVGSKLKQDLQETLVLGVQNMGRGKVMYMVDNPLFRGFWYQGKLLFSDLLLTE